MSDGSLTDSGERREGTVRVVRSAALQSLFEDPVDLYQHHFIHLIERHLEPSAAVNALDLACGTGVATLALLDRLSPGSRVVSLATDRTELRLFHEQLPAALRSRVFPRKEHLDRLPFAHAVFDLVWAALPREQLRPLRAVLRQALRVLRPGGQLIITAPLVATFAELCAAMSPALESHQQDPAFASLMTRPPDLLDPAGWVDNLRQCGGLDPRVKTATIQIQLALPLAQQPLFTRYLLPLWVGEKPEIQQPALRLLDVALRGPISVVVHIGCIVARRGPDEIPEDTVSR